MIWPIRLHHRPDPPLENVIRAEVFSVDRLKQHAASLADAQQISDAPLNGRPLLKRVAENETVLRAAYNAIDEALRDKRWITPAAEWLVENFHIVDEQLREIRDDLPAGFYRELPKLSDGPLAGLPRVYGIAWAFVAHTDSRFDPVLLQRFVAAYQEVQPLSIGEIWAIAITMRVVLVENLRRAADATVRAREARQLADAVADDFLNGHPGATQRAAAGLEAYDGGQLGSPFAVELLHRLRDQDPSVTPAAAWLRDQLQRRTVAAEELVSSEHQREAALTVTVRNIITSMRTMSAFDWSEFFEAVSLVDVILREDPTFAAMSFRSRDEYRHAVEELSRSSERDELDVARLAVDRARNAAVATPDLPHSTESGYYLVDRGRRQFERDISARPPLNKLLRRLYLDAAKPGYLGTIIALTAIGLLIVLHGVANLNGDMPTLLILGVLAAIPASDIAIAMVNRSVAEVVPPAFLPRLELSAGIPTELRTLVVIPSLLGSPEEAQSLADRLEIHYLANDHGDVWFALLTDWVDAGSETTAEDTIVLDAANAAISRLNERYGPRPDGARRFLLLHRYRRWNAAQGVWMGWERKRGKLHELNRLLRNDPGTTFMPEAAAGLPTGVRYVITLDSDTQLPIGAVRKLVGTIAHPLNHGVFDAKSGRVTEGYGVLQPRVTAPLPGRAGSIYQHLAAGQPGIDPYASAVSDVYQDVFDEGSYTGKGLYDVDLFEQALAGRIPDNTLLSHDLFEGVYVRTGLVTDIELFEAAPPTYASSAARQHRWARGDWQLLPWVVGRRLPLVARWKMFDNLRRTLSAPAAVVGLVASWLFPGNLGGIWSAFIVTTIITPLLIPVVVDSLPRARGISKRSHVQAVRRDLVDAMSQGALTLLLLAAQAALMCDAIVRTLWRVLVSRRRLLTWVTWSHARVDQGASIGAYYRSMAGAVVVAVAGALLVIAIRPTQLPAALPWLVLWMLSPALAHLVSQQHFNPAFGELSSYQRHELRLIARRTWRFFEEFVTAAEHHLPPDNFQESPEPLIARRTSPTNIGLSFLATMAARDCGWIGTLDAVDRIEATLNTMSVMQRFRGHWYNWYATDDLRPLEPRYISSVDSGNLAGALVAVGNICRELHNARPTGAVRLTGLADSAELVRREARSVAKARRLPPRRRRRVYTAVDDCIESVNAFARHLPAVETDIRGVSDAALLLRETVIANGADGDTELMAWVDTLQRDIGSRRRDWTAFAPWQLDAQPVSAAAQSVVARLDRCDTLEELPTRCAEAVAALTALPEGETLRELRTHVEQAGHAAAQLSERLDTISRVAHEMVRDMEFAFLYDRVRNLFSIGYRVDQGTLDPGFYDLLASEARLLTYLAIAKGDVPVSSWFHLGRPLVPVGRDSALMSWSGSMFEYIMPALLMRTPVGSLLEQTCRVVVQRQIDYGDERNVPWGISESGYSARNPDLNYRYSAFGVPGLGIKRGLYEDLVIAPYATGLAAMIDPAAAIDNFDRLEALGALGPYGFYEAVDYTPSRLPPGSTFVVVHSYMAHHQGMLLVSIDNALDQGIMRTRFHAEPMVQATELLLQERTPRNVLVARPQMESPGPQFSVRDPLPHLARQFSTPYSVAPRTHLLSNGRYSVMVTSAGGGYSRWNNLAVTRWREDATQDDMGSFIYVRDVDSGVSWSAPFQPRRIATEEYDARFLEDRAEFTRRDGNIVTRVEVMVSPEDDAELRRVSITNHGTRSRELDVTSYAEVVLAAQGADLAHPAFSNLFVRTEYHAATGTLLVTRRVRAADEAGTWLAHLVSASSDDVGELQHETDRARFIGRTHSTRDADGALKPGALSGTTGPVLDPIISLRRRVRIRPGRTVKMLFATIVQPTRDAALELADKYREVTAFDRTAMLAWTRSQMELHHLDIARDEAHLFQTVASALIYPSSALRAPQEVQVRATGGAPSLWSHGISGDLPILLVLIDDAEDVAIVRQLLRAHDYWRAKRLAVDMVILNDRAPSYLQDLQQALQSLTQIAVATTGDPAQGRVFVLRSDQLSAAQRDTLYAAARIMVSSRTGSLTDQILRVVRTDAPPEGASDRANPDRKVALAATRSSSTLLFDNGLGGFTADGKEYIIRLRDGMQTPAPWSNIIANPSIGFLTTDSGANFTWAENSQANLLTPWSNDPVSDRSGERFYIDDRESGELWSPASPTDGADIADRVVHHGFGYSRFEEEKYGIAAELLQFVAKSDPVKVSRLRISNRSGRTRQLGVTAYAEWVLGTSRTATAQRVLTEVDGATGAIFARNSWNVDFADRIAFADLGHGPCTITTDRSEFLGRNGTADRPAALDRGAPLAGRVGAGLDACAAMQRVVTLAPDETIDVTFLLGQCGDRDTARTLISRYRDVPAETALGEATAEWDGVLQAVQVHTPDPAFDVMMNGWLLYQTLASRIWGRAAFYQNSGAYGFRDQLQDVMALCVARPAVARDQILRAAARQFAEGDVQHWWHPPTGRGIRTRFSDDLLWLPYVVDFYVTTTGDTQILDEVIPFIEGPLLVEGQAESYFEPHQSSSSASLFEHCARAIDRSLAVGTHGLPLMGSGDWNDGMNLVGIHGQGESVWLGWFLGTILEAWSPRATFRGDDQRSSTWSDHRDTLKHALDRDGWDGGWYRRAYFDDGTPLGSAQNTECRIDSIAQTWSVMSGMASEERQRTAMTALDAHLTRHDDGVALLLTPPFDHSRLDPGYIKGYPPGVRENGAQYTHAAAWAVIAHAMLGDGDAAFDLFSLINPINHTLTQDAVSRYRVEPYVLAGDVYSEAPHVGRGGWTWYSGSAGWMYRAGLEAILGFKLRGDILVIDPCVPKAWRELSITFRYRSTTYQIHIDNASHVNRGVKHSAVDGQPTSTLGTVELRDDGMDHRVDVALGS